jgi:organic hydroperoxide reductase OsmC/OhrA
MSLLNAYSYEVALQWTGRRAGHAAAADFPVLEVSAPPEFSGEPGKWTPEHLLVASVASCLMTTFLAIASLSRFDVIAYRSNAVARLEKVPGEGYRFTEIVLTPVITVHPADREKAEKALRQAEKHCFISNSLRATVQVAPQFLAAALEPTR